MTRDDPKLGTFKRFVGNDIRILRIAGLYSMDTVFTGKERNATRWETLAFAFGIMQISLATSCEFRSIVRLWRQDLSYAIGIFTVMFSGILCAVKGLRLLCWRDDFHRLLSRFAVMWDEADSRDKIREENLKSASDTSFIGKCYVAMVVTLVTSYTVRPYILLLQHHYNERQSNVSYDYSETVFPTYYPFPTDTMTAYILCVSWEQVVITVGGLYWMISDTIFAQLATHTAIQFRVLRHDLEFIATADEIFDANREKNLVNRLCTIAQRHQDLYMYCEMIETIYNPIIFLTMVLIAANMCFCVFRLDKELSQGNWGEVIKYLFHALSLVVQAVIYCGYADKLSQQSSLMVHAAYECQWIKRSREFKTILQIIMMRSQKPFNCTAYGFFSVNLNQITAIANTAASYFALLKTMT